MKKFILLALVTFVTFAAQAQIVGSRNSRITVTKTEKPMGNYNRIYAGFVSSTYDPDGGSSENPQGVKLGYLYGYMLDKTLPIFLRAGIEGEYVTDNIEVISLDVPFSVSYKYTKNNFYVEPYAGISLRGNIMANAGDDDYDFFDEDYMGEDNTWNRFQLGGQLGLNLGYKAFNFNIGYRFYTPAYSNDKYDASISTSTFTVGLGLNF